MRSEVAIFAFPREDRPQDVRFPRPAGEGAGLRDDAES